MNVYGVEVNGIDITQNKIVQLSSQVNVIDGKNYTIQVPQGGYYTTSTTIDSKLFVAACSSNRKKISHHRITTSNNIINIEWVNEQPTSPLKLMSIYIWG